MEPIESICLDWRNRLGACWLLLACAWIGSPAADGAEAIRVVAEDGSLAIRSGDRDLLVYQSQPNPFKVYVQSLTTPAGRQILRDSPHDHIHHRALMYAMGVDGVDFWGEAPGGRHGKQIPAGGATRSVAVTADDLWQANIEQDLDWRDADGQVLLREERHLRLDGNTLPGATLLVWDSQFRTPVGKQQVELWGRHYFGLGLRMVASMDQGGKLLTPADDQGEVVRGTEKLLSGPWCAYTAAVDGHPVTVAMFDHPDNRPKATWFTMTGPFAYLSATLGLKDEKLAVKADAPLRLRYAVALWDGEKTTSEIAEAHSRWKP
ncbi:MAG: PmoA family protein [Pirellulaceae bacterium]|nr:PmoA family protein [Pirellulaceae bacterium]